MFEILHFKLALFVVLLTYLVYGNHSRKHSKHGETFIRKSHNANKTFAYGNPCSNLGRGLKAIFVNGKNVGPCFMCGNARELALVSSNEFRVFTGNSWKFIVNGESCTIQNTVFGRFINLCHACLGSGYFAYSNLKTLGPDTEGGNGLLKIERHGNKFAFQDDFTKLYLSVKGIKNSTSQNFLTFENQELKSLFNVVPVTYKEISREYNTKKERSWLKNESTILTTTEKIDSGPCYDLKGGYYEMVYRYKNMRPGLVADCEDCEPRADETLMISGGRRLQSRYYLFRFVELGTFCAIQGDRDLGYATICSSCVNDHEYGDLVAFSNIEPWNHLEAQWIVNKKDGLYAFKNKESGLYMGICENCCVVGEHGRRNYAHVGLKGMNQTTMFYLHRFSD